LAVSIDWPTKVITIPKADTTLVDIGPPEIRALDTNQFRKDLNALQAGENGMPFDTTHTHIAPITIGGVTLARSVEIINGYTITFENGAYAVNLTESNNNISDVVNLNTVSIRSANSAGLTSFPQIDLQNIKLLVENLRADHTGQGTIFYWNPDAGDDNLTGLTQDDAVATFAQAHSLATSGAHDIIVALSGSIGITTTTEAIEITKNDVFLRGPGSGFQIIPTSTTAPTVKINALGVEVSSMVVGTAATGGQNAIEVATGANDFLIKDIRIPDAQNDGINVSGTVAFGKIDSVFIEDAIGDGVHLDGDIHHVTITGAEIEGCGGNGIYFSGTTVRECVICCETKLYTNTGYGIRIDSPGTRIFIDQDVSIYGNTAGTLLDNGTATEIRSVWTDDLTESYPVDGQSAATPAQMLYSINQMLSEFARTGTTVSIKKRDGTEAFQLTLDSATAPTSSTQST